MAASIAIVVLGVGGCSSDEDPGFGNGPGRDSGPVGDGVTGTDSMIHLDAPAADINPDGPMIEITEPAAGGMIFSNQVVVRATVTDASGLDASSVVVNIVSQPGDPSLTPQRRMDLVDALANLWEATVPLGGVVGGTLYVQVSASDTDDPVNSNTASLKILHDDGPDIEFLSPTQDDLYFHGALNYAFRVLYDEGTAPASCTLDEVSVSGQAFSPTLTVMDPCTWGAALDFVNDFDPDLKDNRYVLVVRATNGSGTQATGLRTFYTDDQGPTITFLDDYVTANDIITGTVEIRAAITDPSGVAANTVVAKIAGATTQTVPLLLVAPDTYSTIYDTSQLGDDIVTVTIDITAEDLWGTEATASIQVHIDNAPPVISLHPPAIRNLKVESGLNKCSWQFDPVGWDTADDPSDPPDYTALRDPITGNPEVAAPGWCQPQVFFLRARVEDAAHQREGQAVTYPSYVDPDSVELFAYDGAQPLVVDLDADGFCDDINPALEPTPDGLPGEAWHNTMHAIPTRGVENFTPGDPTLPAGCLDGSDADPPVPLCQSGPMTSASFQGSSTTDPVVFTLGVPGDGGDCTGTQFDALGNGFGTGWICLAVRARDEVGNIGISDPMRVYVDLTNSCSSPPSSATAPSCTDGCGYHAWASVFPPFPQKFVSSGEIHRVQ